MRYLGSFEEKQSGQLLIVLELAGAGDLAKFLFRSVCEVFLCTFLFPIRDKICLLLLNGVNLLSLFMGSDSCVKGVSNWNKGIDSCAVPFSLLFSLCHVCFFFVLFFSLFLFLT